MKQPYVEYVGWLAMHRKPVGNIYQMRDRRDICAILKNALSWVRRELSKAT